MCRLAWSMVSAIFLSDWIFPFLFLFGFILTLLMRWLRHSFWSYGFHLVLSFPSTVVFFILPAY